MVSADGAVVTRADDRTWTTHHAMTLDLADTMRFSVMRNPIAMQALATGKSELSLYSKDPITGILKRCRIDRMHEGGNAITDIKTTVDARYGEFQKAIANYGYHVQGAYYLDICNELGMEKECFVILALEKEPPYAVACYQLSTDAIETGRKLYRKWLETLAECIEQDEWPGYPEKFNVIDLPAWAR